MQRLNGLLWHSQLQEAWASTSCNGLFSKMQTKGPDGVGNWVMPFGTGSQISLWYSELLYGISFPWYNLPRIALQYPSESRDK